MSTYPLIIYSDDKFGGQFSSVGYGNYPNAAAMGIGNDSISSLKLAAFSQATFYDDYDFSGASFVIYGPVDIASLPSYGPFNDRISSMKVARVEPSDTLKMSCCDGTTPSYQCGGYAPGSALCTAAIANYCPTHLGEARCQAWCKVNTAACDAGVVSFCNSNPTSPYCTCVRSPAATAGVMNPKCVDRKCIDTGYMTSGMLASGCPSIVNCDVKVQLDNSGITLANIIPIQQNCGGGVTTNPTNPKPSPTPTPTPTPTPVNPITQQPIPVPVQSTKNLLFLSIQQNIYAIVLFLFVIVCAIVAYDYFGDDKNSPPNVNDGWFNF